LTNEVFFVDYKAGECEYSDADIEEESKNNERVK